MRERQRSNQPWAIPLFGQSPYERLTRNGEKQKWREARHGKPIFIGVLVGAGRFERPTPCAQGNIAMHMRRATTSNKIKELRGNHLQSINRHVVNSVADRFIRFQ